MLYHTFSTQEEIDQEYNLRLIVDNRDELIERLKKSNVPTAVHYPTPLHLQNPYYNNQLKLPIAEYISKKIVSLPMHPYLKNKDIEKISQILLIK